MEKHLQLIKRRFAKRLGMKHYFTGKPCRKGHISERYVVNTDCVMCRKLKHKREYPNEKDRIIERQLKWYYKNKDYVSDYARSYRERNPDYFAEWCKNNPEKMKHYYEKNKHKYSANSAERRAELLKRKVVFKDEDLRKFNKKQILSIYKERRRISKETGVEHHVDHTVPLRGKNVSGLHVWYNLQIISAEENLRKGNKFEETM